MKQLIKMSDRRKRIELAVLSVMIAIVSFVHYRSVDSDPLVHEVTQRLYYLPILYAASRYGFVGGSMTAILSIVCFVIHAPQHMDEPDIYYSQYAEMIVFFVVGATAGLLSDAQRREHRRHEQTLEELARAYKELRETVDQLLLADRLSSLGQLSAALIHEIRNPLASIKGAVEALCPDIPPEHRKRQFLDAIKGEAERLNKLVTDFLQFARPREPELLPVQPNDVVYAVVQLVGKEAIRLGVRLSVHLDTSLPRVMMDGEQIKQALLNLVINGMQAAPRGGEVQVATIRRQDAVGIRVKDSGSGISPDVASKLLTPFVTTKAGGTGLGLVIAERLVKQHHGTIHARNASEGGAVFEIELPLEVTSRLPESVLSAPAQKSA